MKCLFCHREGEKTSRDHIISEPIAGLMGVDRDRDLLAVIDGANGEVRVPAVPFSSHTVRGPCETCNNGWMNRVDQSAADVITRLSVDRDTVQPHEVVALQRWLLKTFFVFGLRGDNFQNPVAGESLMSSIVPDPTQAKALRDGDDIRALRYSGISVGRVSKQWPLTAFGNARTNPTNLKIFAGTLVLCLPVADTQFWVVNPTLSPVGIRWPVGVGAFRPGIKWDERGPGRYPDPRAVTVDFMPPSSRPKWVDPFGT